MIRFIQIKMKIFARKLKIILLILFNKLFVKKAQ